MTTNATKTPRNALCPCGSGRKFKRCCLRREDGLSAQVNLRRDALRAAESPAFRFTNRLLPAVRSPNRNRAATWKHVFCEVPLEGPGFLTLTLAYTSESLRRNGIRSGQFLTLDLPEIEFHGEAFVQCLQDTVDAALREGELLLAIQRENEGDPGVMLYGQGNLAQQALDQRRARSREIVLVIDKPNGDRADIRLIRSVDWIEKHNAKVGGEIFLDLPHMGARGFARVVAIESCPPLGQGAGRLVTGTFRHTSGEVYDLKLASESNAIGVTATHPFWSVDRNGWVSAIDLQIGEKLKTLEGTTVVESLVRRPGSEPVYNIEVEGDHVYRVGESGVLVHNASVGTAFLEALQNCCGMKSTLALPKCGSGAKGPLFNTGDLTDAFKKEASRIVANFCTAVPGLQVDSVEYIESLTTAEVVQVHVLVSKPGDGISPAHNISMKGKFCCDGNELWVEIVNPHWGSREGKPDLTYPGCPDRLH